MKEIKGNQSGRSMVEMLGVLAIIGVLSITAVGGYRWAMDKMAANDIVNEVKKRAVVASQQRIVNHALDLSEFAPKIRDTYTVSSADNYNGNGGAFTLSVSDIDEGVCDKLVRMDWLLPVITKLNDADLSDTSTCAETNTILYVFNNDLDMGTATGEPTEPTCGPNEYVDVNTGECVEDTQCSVGEFFHSGKTTCEACPANIGDAVEMDSGLEDNCSKCEGGVAAGAEAGDYYCFNCPSPRVACGMTCCEKGKVCKADSSSWPYTYTCVSPQCTSDANCGGETPLCDMVNGTCFAGCRDNDDCQEAGSGDWFCDLDVRSTGGSCTQKPGRGTCKRATGTPVGNYTRSTDYMNWWSAENFCQAIGEQMADPLDKCTTEEWAQIKANGNGGSCEALKGIEADWNSYQTKRLISICDAWSVDLRNGYVGTGFARYHTTYALCE